MRDFTDISDVDLLVAYAAGETRAATVLTRRLTPRVLAQAVRLLGNRAEAEEVTQEAMLRLWRAASDHQRRAQDGQIAGRCNLAERRYAVAL